VELANVGTPAVEAELTFCAVGGAVRAGGNCSGGEACGPGLTCATDSSGTVCSPVCLLDAGTCPSSTCQSLGAVEGAVSYGFCPTAPTARNGQPCTSESDCSGGSCIELGGTRATCVIACQQDSDCSVYGTSTNPSVCRLNTNAGTFCSIPCTPAPDAGCPDGLECFADQANVGTNPIDTEFTDCRPTGTIGALADCSSAPTQCGPGLLCVDFGPGDSVCTSECRVDDGVPCASPQTCQALGSAAGAVNYGICE
jgi:hypothetical protein